MKKGVQSMDLALQGLRLEVMSSDQACLLVHCPDNDYVPLCACVCVWQCTSRSILFCTLLLEFCDISKECYALMCIFNNVM